MKSFFIITCISFFLSLSAFGQQADSLALKADTVIQKIAAAPSVKEAGTVKDSLRLAIEKMPRKAAFRSAILPGLGQVYNKRWWKVPLIYGGFVGLGLIFEFNNRYYKSFLKEAQYRYIHPGEKQNPLYANLIDDGINLYKDAYRRNRDLSVLGGVAFYAINIIDAYVDAKFFRYDISDNLTLRVKPAIQRPFANSYIPAIKISLFL